jgi:hypothetical protein
MIPTLSASLGLLKGWRTPANKLLANCYQFTSCNCETILIYISFKAWEDAPKVLRHAFISKCWAFGARASGGHHDLGGGTCKVAGTKNYEHTILRLHRN